MKARRPHVGDVSGHARAARGRGAVADDELGGELHGVWASGLPWARVIATVAAVAAISVSVGGPWSAAGRLSTPVWARGCSSRGTFENVGKARPTRRRAICRVRPWCWPGLRTSRIIGGRERRQYPRPCLSDLHPKPCCVYVPRDPAVARPGLRPTWAERITQEHSEAAPIVVRTGVAGRPVTPRLPTWRDRVAPKRSEPTTSDRASDLNPPGRHLRRRHPERVT
jgi:hypothetical protein